MEAHNHAMKLSDRRALEINAQHPQRDGRGKLGRTRRTLGETKFESDEEHDDNLEGKGHSAPGTRLSRLVGSGKAKANKKALTQKIGEKSEELHKLEHEAIENDHYKQGGALASHLVQKYGKEHAKMFGEGYMRGAGLSGGNIDIMTGNNDVGRVANPPASFERNTVGMGMEKKPRRVCSQDMSPRSIACRKGEVYKEPFADGINPRAMNGVGYGLSGGVSTQQPTMVSPNRHHLGGMGMTGGDYSGGIVFRKSAGFKPLIQGLRDTGLINVMPGVNAIAKIGDAVGLGKKKRAKASPSDARRKRGQEVSRLMKQEGMTLGQASKHIKEHGY
jgi:hypothetical protein